MKKEWRLSASAISCFKSCPMRFYFAYVLGIRLAEDTDTQRMGSNWHRILEIYNMKPGTVCPECAETQKNMNCPLCEGTDILPDDMMDAVIRHLNQAYMAKPVHKTVEEWETERIKLLYSLVGYNWYYQESLQQEKIIGQELRFRIPLVNPVSSRALPNVVVDGKIDKIIAVGDRKFIKEHKSTSSSLDQDSTYWNHLRLDTQTTLYPFIARHEFSDISVLYDVWRKPTISPKKLSQADSKKFVETGEYCGGKFKVKNLGGDSDHPEFGECITINNVVAQVEPGAKEGTFAIRETPEMYGARLLQDITERPEYYFVQKELSRTDVDYERFHNELINIYRAIKFMEKNNGWWVNEAQCEATFKCPYLNFCYNNVTSIDVKNLPEGFKCIFGDKNEQS